MQSETVLAVIPAPPRIELPLCTINPARFKAFAKLMENLVKLHGPRPIAIRNSRLLQAIGQPTFLVDIDLGNILVAAKSDTESDDETKSDEANSGLSFDFQATANEVKQLKDLIGKPPVNVYDRGNRLVFSDGQQEVPLWKPSLPVPPLTTTLPTDDQRIGEDVVIEDRSALHKYCGKCNYVSLLVYADQLEKVVVPGKQPRALAVSAGGIFQVDRSQELVLTSQNFLALAGDLELTVGIYRNDLGYWLKTSSKPSMVNNLTTYELMYAGRV